MSRASTKTKLPLDVWARIIGVHPLHFAQVRLENNPFCGDVWFQYPWQTADHASREDVAIAIADAESRIEKVLGYRLTPSWEVDEWQPTTRPYFADGFNLNSHDLRGLDQSVRANWGYAITGGREAKSLIDDNVAIVYSDNNSDGYKETATVTVPTSVLDINEIGIFYPGKDGDDAWEIRPIEVSISAGTATITFKRELAVLASLLDLYDIEGAEAIGTDDSDFLTVVDVYRRYNDPQTQASFLWEPFGDSCGCNGTGCASCSYATQTGCLLLRGDPRQSILVYHPADWSSDDLEFTTATWALSRQPDIVRLYYYAGMRNKSQRYTNRMDPEWERAVTYMAAASLERPPCDCAKGDWSMWRQDLNLARGDEDGKPIYRDPGGLFGKSVLDNPFGSRRGELFAWRKVRENMMSHAILV